MPRISVILPVLNEAESLPGLLEQLLAQQYPPDRFEILVADGGSTDGTRAVVLDAARGARAPIRLIDNPGRRSGPGRNAGIRAASGEVILFIDGHCRLPSPRLLAETARLLDETGADCLCRPQPLLAPSPGHTGQVIAQVRASWLGHGRDSLIYNLQHQGFVDPASSGATYRKQVFGRVGLYDETFDACEDVELNTRVAQAGLRAYTHPALGVYYEPRGSLAGLWRQMLRYGRGRARLMAKHRAARSAAQLAPSALLLSSGSAVLLGLVWAATGRTGLAVAAALLGLPALGFLPAVLAASLQLGARHGRRTLLQAPLIFVIIYGGLGLGLLLEAAALGALRLPHTMRTQGLAPVRDGD